MRKNGLRREVTDDYGERWGKERTIDEATTVNGDGRSYNNAPPMLNSVFNMMLIAKQF